tara:strand:+ start:25924 stop:27459 length:1536 start_codon:yes stop_codon:yes gene_type:complete
MSILTRHILEDGRREYILKSPVDLSSAGSFIATTKKEIVEAVDRGRLAQKKWSILSYKERAAYMHSMIDEIIKNQDEIMEVVMKETGKPKTEALSMEVYAAVDSLSFYAKRAEKLLKPKRIKLHGVMNLLKKAMVLHKPLGVIGIITPWNGPFILALNPAVQALLAGNAVIIKPSEVTPFSSKLVEKLFLQSGLPDNLVQVLVGDGQTGEDLVQSSVDKISFTGSVATGKKVAMSCSEKLVPFTLELGGNDAMIVCDDADIDKAASGALIGSCMNAGQYCCGTERIYVTEGNYDEFIKKLSHKASLLIQNGKENADVGSIVWDKQLMIIEEHVQLAIDAGAILHTGGKRNTSLPGLYFEPTVLSNVDHSMKIMNEETFGPIACVQKVIDEEEALMLANDSSYGLNGNIWTENREKGIRLANKLNTGAVSINDMAMSYGVNEVPFGGIKNSGFGLVNGVEGLKGYCHPMPIITERFSKGPVSEYPYSEKTVKDMQGAIKLFWGSKLIRKIFG